MIRIGQKFYEERIKRGLTLQDIARATKIRTVFLSAIEKGDYQKLPSGSYTQGFIRNYAEYLGLPKRETLALFRREFDDQKAYKVLPDGFSKGKEFSVNRFKLQEMSVAIILLFFLALTYIVFQYRYAIINPPLEVYLPRENSLVSSTEITVSGKTDLNALVYINNSPISLNKEGVFKKTIDLFPGKRTIIIKSINRFGKETVLERHINIE